MHSSTSIAIGFPKTETALASLQRLYHWKRKQSATSRFERGLDNKNKLSILTSRQRIIKIDENFAPANV